jgi:hypothetical protein
MADIPPYVEPRLPPELEAKLLALIKERKPGMAMRRLQDATGLHNLHCSVWVKERIPFKEWYPPPSTLCPYCGTHLKTDLAKQCVACGMDWHDAANPVQH